MIIVNADDWGRSRAETDAALFCYSGGRITSVTAMVFMEDSIRAAQLIKGTGIDVGLHLNLIQQFTEESRDRTLNDYQNDIVGFLKRNKYNILIYNPSLRKQFRYIYEAQVEEFIRLYGKPPSHIDGHQHMHLCANIVLDGIIPDGTGIRRNFYFRPGEKSFVNRSYRQFVDRWLLRRYRMTDYFFSLSQSICNGSLTRIAELAKSATVELMTHPVISIEYQYLMSNDYLAMLSTLKKGTYSSL